MTRRVLDLWGSKKRGEPYFTWITVIEKYLENNDIHGTI